MDGEMADEIDGSLEPVRAELERLQEEALFTGEYDAERRGRDDPRRRGRHRLAGLGRDAAAHVPALGGGPRLRAELVEASPGEEAGLKSATFTVKGENALRDAEGRARRAPARAPLAVRQRAPAAHVVRAGDRQPAARGRRRGRDRRGRPPDRHLPRERRRRPAREQDRLRGPDHAPADRHRRPVPERALADVEQADGDAHPPLAPRRAARGGARGRARARARRGRRTRASAARSAATSCTRTSS